MTQIAVERAERKRAAVPMQAPGSAFFALMAGLWGSFVTLLAVSPQTLEDAYDWLRGLALVPELVMWLLTLPWTVAYLVYETSWQHWVRVLLVAGKRVGAGLVLCALTDPVRQVLDLAGFLPLFTIETSRDSAISRLARA